MTADDTSNRYSGRRVRGTLTLVLAATLTGILLCGLAISFLATTVHREIDALAVANSDTTQWSLVQTEVELLALQVAIHATEHQAVPDLAEIRKRYDILYSRIRLIADSKQFAELRLKPDALRNLGLMQAFLDRHIWAIDGSDADLLAHLPRMFDDVASVRVAGRELSLLGVRFYAADSDAKRESVANTLAMIGYLTAALVAALLGGLAVLVVMFRRSIRSERAAADARNRLQEVIATSLDGIIATDADGRVIEYNGAAERVFGYTHDEAIGQDMADLIVPDHLRAAHAAGMKRYRRTKEKHVVGKGLVRLEAQRKNGTVFPVELSLSSATFNGREIFVSYLRDISDRVAAEQELILARDRAVAGELAKAQLLAVMSHEMRTPLNGILGTIQLIEGTTPSPKQRRFISAMKTSAELLLHHVNGVLSMSRAEAGQLDLQPTDVDPTDLVQELVESQRHAIEANGNRITFDTSAAPSLISADPLRLRQVILNLIGNANKFTRNGDILVECDRTADGNQVEFRVIDTGIGIAEADLERIFEEFQTLDTSYGRLAEGTGLGLAISRRLVRAMGGEIGVDSEPGEGSLFWLRLPIGRDGAVTERPEPQEKPAPRPIVSPETAQAMTLLLVEDNPINRLVAREMLQSAGHQVMEAHDGREGVRLAAMKRYDAILMDISMPELDGVQATRIIRSEDGPNRRTPIIALTAHALPEDTRRFLEAGINDTLLKPLSMETLNAMMAQIARSNGLALENPAGFAQVMADLSHQIGATQARHLLTGFRAEGEALVQRCGTADWSNETAEARAQAVHKLAGSAAVLGAGALRTILQGLEGSYRRGDLAEASAGLGQLSGAWIVTRDEIDRMLAGRALEGDEPEGNHGRAARRAPT
jgi:PAS domain S-box-containing protein